MPGGPSEAAGIAPWDRIVLVDDSVVAGKSIKNEDVLKKLRGEGGTEVKLGIKGADSNEIHDIIVTRGNIPSTV